MERLLELAMKSADQAAVYSADSVTDGVGFENGRLKDISSGMESGVNLLLMKDGKLGMAYTRNLIDRGKLVNDALVSLSNGVAADYELPAPANVPVLDTYAEGIEKLTSFDLVEECNRICSQLAGETHGQANAGAMFGMTSIRLLNSKGADLKARFSSYNCSASLLYPGSHISVHRGTWGKEFVPFPDDELQFIAGLYRASQKDATPVSGRTRVMFLPEAMYALVWRLIAATEGKNVYEKVSPLKDKLGQQVMSPELTFTNIPLGDSWPGARSFDDEGTPCRNLPLVEEGVLRNFYYDLFYASKSGVGSTGNGFRGGITTKTAPALEHLELQPGNSSFEEMVRKMGQGVIVAGVMGAHSGNILNGDYSIGLAPGLWVEDGEIVGRAKDAMVSGNIYETMRNVIAVQDRVYPGYMARTPAVLFDGVSFTARG